MKKIVGKKNCGKKKNFMENKKMEIPNEILFKILIEFQNVPILNLNKNFYKYYKTSNLYKIKHNLQKNVSVKERKISIKNILHHLNYLDLLNFFNLFKQKDKKKIMKKILTSGYLDELKINEIFFGLYEETDILNNIRVKNFIESIYLKMKCNNFYFFFQNFFTLMLKKFWKKK
jgi:hypothetical protein